MLIQLLEVRHSVASCQSLDSTRSSPDYDAALNAAFKIPPDGN